MEQMLANGKEFQVWHLTEESQASACAPLEQQADLISVPASCSRPFMSGLTDAGFMLSCASNNFATTWQQLDNNLATTLHCANGESVPKVLSFCPGCFEISRLQVQDDPDIHNKDSGAVDTGAAGGSCLGTSCHICLSLCHQVSHVCDTQAPFRRLMLVRVECEH